MSTESFTFSSEALKGNLLGDSAERPVQVVLPSGYANSQKRYPVVYYLHGYGLGSNAGSPMLSTMAYWFKNWAYMFALNQETAGGDLTAAIQLAMQPGQGQEMILVFPNASNRLGGSLFLSSPTIGDYETYLTKELVGYVDSHYRTLAQRESRAVAGCSMGADGAVHLGMKFPEVYGVVAAQSGTYFWDRDPTVIDDPMSEAAQASAAAVAPNPNNPPDYFDKPFLVVNGKATISPDLVKKLIAHDPRSDVEQYLAKPQRLDALLVQHGKNDRLVPVELGRDFDKLLTQEGIAHDFDDSFDGHCSFDMVPPMLKFLSDHLVGERNGR